MAVPVLPFHGRELRGDVAVMRVAADGDGVVNMRGLDTILADWMMER